MVRRTAAFMLFALGYSVAVSATCMAADPSAKQPGVGTSASETSQARIERFRAQVESGEFGPALETAQSTTNPQDRETLLKLIADKQADAGDFASAMGTAGRLSSPESRTRKRADVTHRSQLSGGGTGANYGPLINIIQDNTGGPNIGEWREDGGEGTITPGIDQGVRVNPHGLLYRLSQTEQTGRLAALSAKARVAALNEEMSRSSELRFVSLTRLERAVAARLRSGQPVLETMRHLAGISRIQYVFVYPEERELIIAGPAEGWQYNSKGLPVGVSSGRPTLQLDDLVTVLRTFAPTGKGIFGCSINPRVEGMRGVKEFVEASQANGAIAPERLPRWLKEIQSRMGLQDIEVYGVPAESRVSQVLVEADYRMKLIGIGKVDGGKGIPSIFELLPLNKEKDPPTLDALRWWLSMKYDAILHSADRNVFEIQGSSVLVQSENQLLTADGEHLPTGKAEVTNRLFAKNFTEQYSELAKRDLVFADLQNIFDMGMVSALCQHEHLVQRIGWDLGVFAATGDYRVATFAAPKVVESVMNHRVYRGRDIVVQVAGGVRADVLSVVNDEKLAKQNDALTQVSDRSKRPSLPAERWWWDAAE